MAADRRADPPAGARGGAANPPGAPWPGGAPAGPVLRGAVMVYEAVLLFGVLFITLYLLLALLQWSHPLPASRRAVVFGACVAALGAYFAWHWRHGGRTLPMRTWDLLVVRDDGSPVSTGQALVRYLLAWHLFVPGAVLIALADLSPGASLLALSLSPFATLLTARFDRQRRLLHDRLTGTRLIRVPPRAARPAG